MQKQPLVSIIISTLNREEYIKRAIESALGQTYKNIEIIIMDGGSTDRTKEVILPYLADLRVQYIYKKDKTPAEGRNNGIRISKGKYIAILDSDDAWCNQKKLEKQVKFLEEHPEYIVTGGGLITINEANQETSRRLNPESDEEIKKNMLFDCLFSHSTVVYRKNAWEKVGGYNEDPDVSEDWDLWLRMGKLGKFYNFPEYFVCLLSGEQNRSIYIDRQILKANIKLRKKYRDDYPNSLKAILLSEIRYFYSLLPLSFRRFLSPLASRIRKIIFNSPL